MRFFRYCESCGRKFNPEGRWQKLCLECRMKVRNVNFIKMLNFRKIMKFKSFDTSKTERRENGII